MSLDDRFATLAVGLCISCNVRFAAKTDMRRLLSNKGGPKTPKIKKLTDLKASGATPCGGRLTNLATAAGWKGKMGICQLQWSEAIQRGKTKTECSFLMYFATQAEPLSINFRLAFNVQPFAFGSYKSMSSDITA